MSHDVITIHTVRRIAHLARIAVSDDALAALTTEMTGILDWIQQLNQVDTQHVDPISRPTNVRYEKPLLRPDSVRQGEDITHLILSNAPEAALNMFAVPKVVE